MTNEEFVSLVREMRECQRKYFRTREKCTNEEQSTRKASR